MVIGSNLGISTMLEGEYKVIGYFEKLLPIKFLARAIEGALL